MLRWEDRPTEVANHLNPAFCSLLLFEAVSGYSERSGQGMAYPLAFLVLPIVLHKPTREILPRNTRTRLHTWIQSSSSSKIGFVRRAQSLKGYTQESLIFGLQRGMLDVDEVGLLVTTRRSMPKLPAPSDSEPNDIRKRAAFLGKWFADAGDVGTVLAMWGVRP